jgi:KaiC/GvpD/RAD55 family RecA-like ATPase
MNDGAAEGATAPNVPVRSGEASALAKALGVGTDTAETLVQAGYSTPDAVRAMSVSALEQLGVATGDVERIRHPPGGASAADPDRAAEQDRIVERWAGTVRKPDRSRRFRMSTPSKDSTETLRKWVDGDDSALEEWISSSEPARPAPYPAAPAPATPVVDEASHAPVESVPAPVLEREETVVRWLTGLLDRVKTDQFDPASLIQETQELHRQLFDEQTKRKQLEEEVEHVKRGSIAVIKYVRSHEAKEKEIAVRAKDDEIAEMKLRLLALEGQESRPVADSPAPVPGGIPPRAAADAVEKSTRELESRLREEFAEREHAYIERETDLRRRSVQLDSEVRNLRAEVERMQSRGEILGSGEGASAEVEARLKEVDQRERDLLARENELRTRFEEIRINADEIERRRTPLETREREIAAADQQLQVRKAALDAEARRLEELRSEGNQNVSASASDDARRAAALFIELKAKEEELKAREMSLRNRTVEVERMAARAQAQTAEADATEVAHGPVETRVKSGIRRLDDLLYGGYPAGAQILVNGPAHTGKDVLARLFSVEGLKQDIPSIWIVTDSTWTQVRDDLAALYPKYAEAEKAGMLRFIDLYTRNVVGSPQSAAGVRMLSSTDKGVLDQLTQSVNTASEELKEKFSTYRIIFESVSTLTAYLDSSATFRFLQPLIGRRKIDQSVGYYLLDRGMHSDSDLETLEHMVDGSINLKIEQLKTFLSVKGVGETQSRAWIGYTFTKRSINLGSFSLDHIR